MKVPLFLVSVVAFATVARAEPPTAAYRAIDIDGFKVLLSPDIAADPKLARALDILHYRFIDIEALMTPAQMQAFRTVTFWIEQNDTPAAATFHRSREWLQDNNKNPDKAGGIEISSIDHFVLWSTTDQPMMIVHELAHAYSHRVLGADRALVARAYRNALDKKLYESVPYIHGGSKRAYALTDQEEYFAELTEAYFGRNDFYPYRIADLQTYDPTGFRLMKKIWEPPPR